MYLRMRFAKVFLKEGLKTIIECYDLKGNCMTRHLTCRALCITFHKAREILTGMKKSKIWCTRQIIVRICIYARRVKRKCNVIENPSEWMKGTWVFHLVCFTFFTPIVIHYFHPYRELFVYNCSRFIILRVSCLIRSFWFIFLFPAYTSRFFYK